MRRRPLIIALVLLALPAFWSAAASAAHAAAGTRRPAATPRAMGTKKPGSVKARKSALRPRPESKAGAAALADDIPRPRDDDADRVRIVRLQDTLADIASKGVLGRLRVGMRVMSARTGRVIFGRRSDVLMDPASNQKLLATTAAVMRLGPDWRFHTVLAGAQPDADGVIAGPVYLRGSGDPTLRAADLGALAERLRARGVVRIDGGVLADPRRVGQAGAAGSAEGERSPLLVNRGIITVRVAPGASEGAAPFVATDPPSAPPASGQPGSADGDGAPVMVVRNQARTRGTGRPRLSVKVTAVDSRIEIHVAGRISPNAPPLAFRRRVPRPALHAALLMRQALVQAGIAVRGGVSTGVTPGTVGVAEVHRSEPLEIVLRRINKDSDNEQAERVLEAVGAEVKGGGASTEKGLEVLREVLDELGVPPASYVPRNGSGLGHANRITASAISELLHVLYTDPRVGPEILQSMSVGGVDGTTRNRFKGSLAAHRVRAKTGTLNGKSCLSGFVGDGDDVLIFSIMVQGFRTRAVLAAVRGAQVGAVDAIMRYVREGTGHRIDLPPGFDQPPKHEDYELGDDLLETDGQPAEAPPSS